MLAVSEKNKTNVGIREHNHLTARSATPCLAPCEVEDCDDKCPSPGTVVPHHA